jgi:enoyl-CoA hydratase
VTEALDPTRHSGTDLVQVECPARRPAAGSHDADAPLDGVALVTLSRPRALNALSFALLTDLGRVVEALDADPAVRAIVITGAGRRAFAAGADIGELVEQTPESLAASEGSRGWDRVAAADTPTIAAVRGYALGGGCELAMACDMLIAGSDAVFGQPEIRLGIIPGAGGTQRLTRAIGAARAMELVLTGRQIRADEAARLGLVTKVVPAEETLAAALDLAAEIAALPAGAARAAKAAVRAAAELPLAGGILHERLLFRERFGTPDQVEGMRAFLEKRHPRWEGRPASPGLPAPPGPNEGPVAQDRIGRRDPPIAL